MRLIDADVLKEKAYSVTVKNEWHMHTNIDVVDMEDIDTAPTIDAVPVVRCKDCASFHYSGMGGDNGITYCARLIMTEMQPTDFCSYGERKDNE